MNRDDIPNLAHEGNSLNFVEATEEEKEARLHKLLDDKASTDEVIALVNKLWPDGKVPDGS